MIKQDRLILETNALKLFITAQSRVRLEWESNKLEFVTIEDAWAFIETNPNMFDSSVYNDFMATLERKRAT